MAADDAGQDQHGRAPVIGRHQASHHRRHRHRRHAHAGGDQRHREAAMGVEPASDGRHHRREDRGRGAADHQAEQQLKLDQGGRAACQRQRSRDHGRSRQYHRQRPELVGQRAPGHAGEGHGEEADGHGGGNARHRPASVARDRLQQHRQREHAADRDTAEQAARGDDDPAIVGTAHCKTPFLLSQSRVGRVSDSVTRHSRTPKDRGGLRLRLIRPTKLWIQDERHRPSPTFRQKIIGARPAATRAPDGMRSSRGTWSPFPTTMSRRLRRNTSYPACHRHEPRQAGP